MVDRYARRFDELRKANKKAFMPFSLLGWPDRTTSFTMIKEMIDCGASALELGIAFSDPVADGPIIQRAAHETIMSGFSVKDAFDLLADVRKHDNFIPIGILVYFNTILANGVDLFFAHAKKSGVDGVLVADLPVENVDEVLPAAKAYGINLIFLVSPVTTPRRLDLILKQANGFLYLVSRLGVTGTGERSYKKDMSLTELVAAIKAKTRVPVCAGFGISSRVDASQMFEIGVDGIISGSRVIQLATAATDHIIGSDTKNLQAYYKEMLDACGAKLPV